MFSWGAPQSMIQIGDPVAPFTQKSSARSGLYTFDMSGGHNTLMFFFPTAGQSDVRDVLDVVQRQKLFSTGREALFFAVSPDPADEGTRGDVPDCAGCYFLHDADRKVHDLFGIPSGSAPVWVEIDKSMHVVGVHAHREGIVRHLCAALHARNQAPAPLRPVPALVLENVLEPEFCRTLIGYHQSNNPQRSAILSADPQGRPVTVVAADYKRRYDTKLRDRQLVTALQARIIRRVVPEIFKVFRFQATQMDRMLVSSYDAADQGFFSAHRDNTVSSSAHRQFAVSINLNDGYDGGALTFPEFGTQAFSAPAGGAIVFSCALLHAVTPVTRGRRYACLPFVY